MPASLDPVAQEALILPPNERLGLARRLLESVDLEPDPGTEAAWQAEIVARIARAEGTEVRTVPGEKVLARLCQIAPEQ